MDWITDYLADRYQYAEVQQKQAKSVLKLISKSIPQGSILGQHFLNIPW